ncbi:MAG: hypothetical protein L0Z50_26795, partial [Verrucomicrobiales bacterium]|nr:hypothetical protein [Verrucomicrobiales bacterium]
MDASCGCALTRANIIGMTPQAYEDQGNTEIYMDRVITAAREARIAGYEEKFLDSLLMSRMVGIKGELAKEPIKNESAILPYIYRQQQRHINSNYWKVVSGQAAPGAGAGGLHTGAWELIVRTTDSRYATALSSIERYFLPGKYLLVRSVDAAAKTAYAAQFKVISSVNDDSGGVSRAKLVLAPNYTDAGWAGLTAAQKVPFQPAAGLVLNMANSVSNYESWCNNEASEINKKLLTY